MTSTNLFVLYTSLNQARSEFQALQDRLRASIEDPSMEGKETVAVLSKSLEEPFTNIELEAMPHAISERVHSVTEKLNEYTKP
jgi:hypothetical protein